MNKCTCKFSLFDSKMYELRQQIEGSYIYSDVRDRDIEFSGSCCSDDKWHYLRFDSARPYKDYLIVCFCEAREPIFTENQLQDLINLLMFSNNLKDVATFLDEVWRNKPNFIED